MSDAGLVLAVFPHPDEEGRCAVIGESGRVEALAERHSLQSGAALAKKSERLLLTLGLPRPGVRGVPHACVEDLLWVLAPGVAGRGKEHLLHGAASGEEAPTVARRLLSLVASGLKQAWWAEVQEAAERGGRLPTASREDWEGGCFCLALTTLAKAARAVPKPPTWGATEAARQVRLPPLDLKRDDAELLEEIFSDRLRKVLGAAYEPRETQRELAGHVLGVLSKGGRLLAEAGTGVGKTFAYGFPAALRALRGDQPVLISTYTKNLQRQLENDFQTIRTVLGLSREQLRVQTLYGRQNYLCGARLRELSPGRLASPTAGLCAAWLVLGGLDRSGDPDLAQRLPDELAQRFRFLGPLHRDVLARRAVCSSETCARTNSCAYQRALKGAQGAHLVICNHALLLQLPQPALGASRIIVDEAHSFPEAATGAFSIEVTARQIEEALSALKAPAEATLPLEEGVAAGNARKVMQPLQRQAESLAHAAETLGRALRNSGVGAANVRLDVGQPGWAKIANLVEDLSEQCLLLAQRAASGAQRLAKENGVGAASALAGVAERLGDVARGLEAVLEEPEGYVRLASSAAPEVWSLQQVLLFPGKALRDRFLEHYEAVVFSSASLSVAGDFSFAGSQLGVVTGETEEQGWSAVSLPSPFDYRRGAGLVVPTDDEFHYRWERREDFYLAVSDALAEVLPRATRCGGVLVLFTNKEEMNRVYETLAGPLAAEGVELIRQEEGGRTEAERAFRARPGSVLFGLRSYFSGADFPGEQLVCVVLVKLPFRSPNDPTEAERAAWLEAEGQDPFRTYALPTAVLDFRQCFGRLIRSHSDYGLVFVLDRRISRFKEFEASIPAVQAFCGPIKKVTEQALCFLEGVAGKGRTAPPSGDGRNCGDSVMMTAKDRRRSGKA